MKNLRFKKFYKPHLHWSSNLDSIHLIPVANSTMVIFNPDWWAFTLVLEVNLG